MLALVGSGEYLPPMEPVDRELIARLPESPRVVCLPTAAGREGTERVEYWSNLGLEHFTRLGAEVQALPVIDRESADDPRLADRIAGANFVYLSGGKPDYLFAALRDTRTWKAILTVLERGGLLAGCSAGAMIQGEKFFGFPGWKSGFKLLPGKTIIPHYDEIPESVMAPMRLLAGKSLTILGIEANTALLKTSGRYEVLGSGGVTVWNKAGKARYTQGVLPNLD